VCEKPGSEAELRERLLAYFERGVPAETVAAVCVADVGTGRLECGVEFAAQWFGRMPAEVMEKVVQEGEVFRCAGGFAIENPHFRDYLGRREGSADSIMGMPLTLTRTLISRVIDE